MLKYAGGEIAFVSISERPWIERTQAVTLADGGWLLTWDDEYGARQQRFDENGVKVGDEIALGHTAYMVEALTGGGWIMGHTVTSMSGVDSDAFISVYDELGRSTALDIRVNDFTAGEQRLGGLTRLSDGGWIVTWSGFGEDHHEDYSNDHEIYQQRYDAAGNVLGQNQLVNTTTEANQRDANVVALQDGGWVVTWGNTRNYYQSDIYMQRYDKDGNKIGVEDRVNDPANAIYDALSLTALAGGGWLAAWTAYDSGSWSIYQQRYGSDGGRAGSQVAVELNGNVVGPQVDALLNGGWVMTYFSSENWSTELRAQIFSADGVQLGREISVESGLSSDFNSRSRTVTALDDGRFVIAWSRELGTDQIDIRQRIFSLTENEGPIAQDDGISMVERETLTTNILTNDADGDNGEKLTLESATVISGNADINFDEDGKMVILDKSHQLVAGQKATVTIEYTVSDGFETDTGLVTIDVTGTTDKGDQVRGTEQADRYEGFDFDDFYFGLGGNDVISGRQGDDFLVGGSGKDRINGGDGADTIVGGLGDDRLYGAGGTDTFNFSPGDGRDVILIRESSLRSRDILDLSDFGFRNFNQVKRMAEVSDFDLIIDLPGRDRIKIDGGAYFGIDVII